MKKILKKLNNYRFTSVIVSIIAVLSGILGIMYLIFYELAGDYEKERNIIVTAFDKDPITGMVYFLFCLFTIVAAILIVYSLFPAILNKEKIQTKKFPLMVSVVNGGFQLVLLILTIVLLARENPHTKPGFIIGIVLNVLTCAGSALAIIPFLKCDFYMPAIKITEKKERKCHIKAFFKKFKKENKEAK